MRFFGVLSVISMTALVGCSTSGLENDRPAFSSQTNKSPQQFARCLAPKWLEYNPSTSAVETETGYKIAASTAFSGVVALAVVDQVKAGSNVRIYLPMDWAGTSGWKESAKKCI